MDLREERLKLLRSASIDLKREAHSATGIRLKKLKQELQAMDILILQTKKQKEEHAATE